MENGSNYLYLKPQHRATSLLLPTQTEAPNPPSLIVAAINLCLKLTLFEIYAQIEFTICMDFFLLHLIIENIVMSARFQHSGTYILVNTLA